MRFLAVSAIVLAAAARQAASFGVSPPPRFTRSSHPNTCPSHQSLFMSQSSDSPLSSTSSSSSTRTSNADAAPLAHDGEALQALFSKQCDDDGLMTKDMLLRIPVMQELLVCTVRVHSIVSYMMLVT